MIDAEVLLTKLKNDQAFHIGKLAVLNVDIDRLERIIKEHKEKSNDIH